MRLLLRRTLVLSDYLLSFYCSLEQSESCWRGRQQEQEYNSASFNALVINTKGIDGNYEFNIKLMCFGKDVLNENIEVNGQEFTGDEQYTKYINCIMSDLYFKAKQLASLTKLIDFVFDNGSRPYETFGIEKKPLETDRSEVFKKAANIF